MVDVAFEADAGTFAEDGEAMPEDPMASVMARVQWLQYVADPQTINFAGDIEEERRGKLARTVLEEYELDRDSMSEWREAMRKGIDLAMLVKGDKSYPFDRAANIKFPLVTSAALQFNARAYPAIVPNGDVVLCRTYGADPQGAKAARAKRVAEHMSYQLSAQVEEWEEETDRLLVALPLVGTVFRKVWFDPVLSRIRVRLCDPGRVIVNDGIRNLEDCPRISEEIHLYPHEIQERISSGQFIEFDWKARGEAGTDEGLDRDSDADDDDAPRLFIEQHRRVDLDEDGYPEPYIVTVHKDSQTVVRMVADFDLDDVQVAQDGRVLGIRRNSHYAAYHFLPSPSGGFFGLGFGLLLGDLSDSVNTIINQLLDTAHLSSLGAGFIGAEFRLKGGANRFRPGEWKQVNTPGVDIRSAIVPLDFPEPSPVMFQLLGLLIEAGREIASVKDVMTGEANRQMTATTTLALIEQGQMLFSAAYKRCWRALKHEFRLIAKINAMTVSPEEYAAFHDLQQPADPAQDYDLSDMDICPVADPRSVTSPQKLAKAQMLMEMAGAGMIDPQAAAMRMLEAASIDDAEQLMPQPDPMAMEAQRIATELEIKRGVFETGKLEAEVVEAITKAIKNIADAEAAEAGPQLDEYKAQLDILRESIRGANQRRPNGLAATPGNAGTSQPVDPAAAFSAARAARPGLVGGGAGPGGMGAVPAPGGTY